MGVAEVPDHLRELFVEAAYLAARQVFEAALSEDVRFVVLSGGIVTSAITGPRGPLFLAEQFARLGEREIEVFWAGSPIDPPESWPAAVKLPKNVHFFPRRRLEGFAIPSDAGPLAQVIGTSCDDRQSWRAGDFEPEATGLYTVAVAHGEGDVGLMQRQRVDYWALGGRHHRSTPLSGAATIHYSGTHQGRRPDEGGIHGCTLIEVDEHRQTRTSLISTDVVRWINEQVVVDRETTREDLESRMRERLAALGEATPDRTLLVSWTATGSGPLFTALRRGSLAKELLESLRGEYGYRSPALWSLSFGAELPETLPPEWYEQETICGDYLRAIRQLQMNPEEPLALDRYLSESHRAGVLDALAVFAELGDRDRVLREAAMLGVDLLSGEEDSHE